MDKINNENSAINIIKKTFQSSFNKESFVYFIKNLLNHIEEASFVYRGNLIPDAYKSYIQSLERIGKYEDTKDDKLIDILVVHLKKNTSLERARTMQRNFIAWYLNGSRGGILKEAALVAFVSPDSKDWRFSLVKMDYQIDTSKKKINVKQEFTPAKRFSFLVGENESCHTAQSTLVPILINDKEDPTLEQLEKAFSIEKVTKDFFREYRNLFLELKESLENIVSKDEKIKKDFKEKNVDITDFAKKLLGQIVFLYFLQKKGWFGVPRGKDWGEGNKRFLRYLFEKAESENKNYFNCFLEPLFYEALRLERPKDYYDQFKCKIPFLNGGLFDPLGDYDWQDTDIEISNKIFSNKEKTKEGDKGNGILDIFDRYNFTVKEDEPLEKEVAVDPEMLGKVFENLLAIKDRKSKGTYYTPRPIVHYMCQQSLINYLDTELKDKVKKEDIEILIKHGESAVEHDKVVEKNGRETRRYFYKLSKEIRKNAKLIDEKLSTIRVCDPAIGSGAFPVGMMSEIVRARNVLTSYIKDKEDRSIYDFKRHAIQSCLYGVDIDSGAIEIAKLRLWLSLIVDEEDIKQIKPLPNLDYKIVCGNSLLGIEKRELWNWKLFKQLEELKPLFFDETNTQKKQEYREEIDALIKEITKGHKEFDFEIYFSEVFHEKKGFDIVIANPPYDVYEGHKRGEIEKIRSYSIYEKTTGGKLNAYKLFLAKSAELQKPNGILCEIFQNSFLTDNSASKIRKYFLQNQEILRIDSFPERDNIHKRVFENVKMSVCILLARNTNLNDYFFTLNIWSDKKMNNGKNLSISKRELINFDSDNITIPLASNEDLTIIKKMAKFSKLIQIAKCYQGEINLTIHKKYLHKKVNGNALMIKGAAIQKWHIRKKMSQGEIEYLDISQFSKKNNSLKSKHYLQKRLVMQGITGVDEEWRLKATILKDEIFCAHSVNYILVSDKNIACEYLLAMINSKLLNWYFKIFSTNSNVNGYEVNNLPIPRILAVKQKPFINFIDKIFDITKKEGYLQNEAKQKKVKEYEKQIDQLVYKLYGLNEKEIKIIENKDD